MEGGMDEAYLLDGSQMKRRTLLTAFAFLSGAAAVGLTVNGSGIFRKIWYRVEDFFSAPQSSVPPEQRADFVLPQGGHKISLEKALNSRCTSDSDGNPRKFHWGMFDTSRRITEPQVAEVIKLSRVPRFTEGELFVRVAGNTLTVIGRLGAGAAMGHIMVEAGMMQQAICLVCAALGIGNVFKNLGVDGKKTADGEIGTVEIVLDAMLPGYDGAYWTAAAPVDGPANDKTALPMPRRDGERTLLEILRDLQVENQNGEALTETALSQILWAARGRTPHLYKSQPWGLTIPTWGGEQNISSVYAISNRTVQKYVNWRSGKWAHALDRISALQESQWQTLLKAFYPFDTFIVLAPNEAHARAFWEIGYQFLNSMAQAFALGIQYKAALLDSPAKNILETAGIQAPAAILMLNRTRSRIQR